MREGVSLLKKTGALVRFSDGAAHVILTPSNQAARRLGSAYRLLFFISIFLAPVQGGLWLLIRLPYPARQPRWLEEMCDDIAKRHFWRCREGGQRQGRLQHLVDLLQRFVEVAITLK